MKNHYQQYIQKVDRDNNMDIVRYILSFGVLISHFNVLCGADIPWIVTSYDRVGGFFALSGFLQIIPIMRGLPFKEFALNRLWRIFPSYLFVVLFFAIGLCLISTLTSEQYFESGKFWKYISVNVLTLNFLCPDLPGVFSTLSINAVNGALWTMKVELLLSLTLPLIFYFIKRNNLNLRRSIILILFSSLIYRLVFSILYSSTENQIYEVLGRQFVGQGIFFYSGILIYTYYEEIKKMRWFFLIITTIIYVLSRGIEYTPFYFQLLHPFVISLLVLSYSLITKNIAKWIDGGNNISYEIYLCHFPIMQLLAFFGMVKKIGVTCTLILGIMLTIIMAVMTYLCVGRLYIRRKQKIKQIVKQ